MREFLTVVLVVVTAGLLMAQTSVRVGMLSGPVGAGGVLVLAPTGQITFATVGTGISLVRVAGGYVLEAQASGRVRGEKPARQPDGTYVVARTPGPGTLAVYRNGVRQSAGDDYAFDAAARKIAPAAGLPWDSDDLVLADYE